MPEPIQHRYDFLFLFDVTDGNPNGDPDAGNAPRVDPETGHGLVSDVCLKRKIRNFICLAMRDPAAGNPLPGYDIYVKEKAILNLQHQRPYEAEPIKSKPKGTHKAELVPLARAWMCQTFFDIRMFGAVMTTGVNCGQVRGPVQLSFARSVDPIHPLPQTITRVAVTTEEKAKELIDKHGYITTEIGSKEIVPYALYLAQGFVSPYLAADTGFSDADLDLLWQALQSMFEHDRSATRGVMVARKLVVFEHASPLGNAPAHSLFQRLKIIRTDPAKPARVFHPDYQVLLDKENLPQGVTVREIL